MSNHNCLNSITIIFALNLLITAGLYGNWDKASSNSTINKQEVSYQSGQTDPKGDSLLEGVTQDWLNSLRDEKGNRIIPENGSANSREIGEDPEGDALQRKILNGFNAGDRFGNSVSSAGDVNGDGYPDVIVGAPNYSSNTGRAYIYFGGAFMNTAPDVILTGEAANNRFGYSVSTAGDVNGDGYSDVIVGADGYSANTGRAYVFFGGPVMDNTADVIMTGEATSNFFGSSVSSAGDVNGDGYSDVIVGARGYSSSTGRAYVFFGGAVMNNAADVIITGEAASNFFGRSVSSAGDVNGDGYSDVIAGARGYSSNTGRAYVFFGGTMMNNAADVTMTGEAAGNFFGRSVSSAGDVNADGYSDVIVGADGYSSDTGRAYIFFGGTLMDNAADVTMTGEATGNSFGWSVSSAGDVNGDGYSDVIVGADGYSSNTGRAYVFFGGAVMNNAADVFMTGEAAGNRFGYSVSSAGDLNGDGYSDLIAGAFGYSSNTGRTYLLDYVMSNEMIADVTLSGEQEGDSFGLSVSSAGDVNNDGYDDIIVGANRYSSWNGRAYVFFGGAVIDNVADVIMTGEAGSNFFGRSVSSAGDVNGDGYCDVIVGANGYSSSTGRAYVYFGGAVMNNTADVIMTGDTEFNNLGYSVSSAGDVNGDGYSDVIVGAYGNPGRAYIYFGGASMNNAADVTMTGEAAGNWFGFSVSSAGDVNGDGYSDVIVGAYGYSSNTGRAYVFFGGAVMNNTADVTMTGEAASNYFGSSVSTAGDVNGDGYSDVIVGAWQYLVQIAGRAYVFFGGPVMDNTADVIMTGQGADYLGFSVSSAGDVNGDGYSDVIVGMNSGRGVNIYFGGAVMNNTADVTMTGEASNQFGSSVSTAGDVNGDGYSDVIVGENGYSSYTGRAYIYLASAISIKQTLNLTMFIEGFYNSGVDSQVRDTITAELRNSTSPFAVADQSSAVVSANGTVQLRFFNAPDGNYYIAVKHRNSIETWSANPVPLSIGIPVNYDFSNAASQAFGNNMIQVDASPVRFAVYSGDANQDGIIDLADGSLIDNDAFNFNSGYLPTDVNGDGVTDLADAVFADNNSFNFVGKITP
ncbi:MAG: FG-GAP repeat protein [Ignavibacteria bacterium]|nr:FG-GAP repeat protein [Ignavibacteria bacterium]